MTGDKAVELINERSQNRLLFLLILVTGVHQSTEKIENLNPQSNEKPVAINFMQFIRKEYCSRKRYKRYSDA